MTSRLWYTVDRKTECHSQFADVRQTLEWRVSGNVLQFVVHQLSVARTQNTTRERK